MKHEKTFAAIEKLKEVEIELHRLKNALEMSNRTGEAAQKREWSSLTDDEIKKIIGLWDDTPITGYPRWFFDKIEAALREKNT